MKKVILLFTFFLFFLQIGLSNDIYNDFSKEEKDYLDKRQELLFLIASEEWEPFSYTDEDGNLIGLDVDFVNLLSKTINKPIKIIKIPWHTTFEKITEEGYDAIISASKTQEREKFLNFSKAYYVSPIVLLSNDKQQNIESISEFKGKRIGVVKGSALVDLVHKDNEIVFSNNGTVGLIELLKNNTVDGVIDYLAPVRNILSKSSQTQNFKPLITLHYDNLGASHYAIKKSDDILLSIINKAIDSYKPEDRRLIKMKWESVVYNNSINKAGDKTNLSKLPLTKEELSWLKTNKSIKVANEPDWPPFDFSFDGIPMGLGIDYIELIAKKIGIQVEYVQDSWQVLLEKFKNGQIDVLHSVYKTPQREEYAIFSDSFFDTIPVVVVRKDSNIRDFKDLENKKIVLIDGFGTSELLSNNIKNYERIKVNNISQALKLVSFEEVDAAIDNLGSVSYAIMERAFTNLKFIKTDSVINDDSGRLHFAFSKNDVLLQSIFQKALMAITPQEHLAIRNKWVLQLPSNEQSKQINLTQDEKNWLLQNPIIKFTGDPKYLPYEAFLKDGQYIGMVADYLDLIENKLGIKVSKIPVQSWDEAILKAKNNEVDFISDYTSFSDLDNTHITTQGYIKSPVVVVSKKDSSKKFVADLSQVENELIAVVKGYGYLQPIYEQYPHLNFREVNSFEEALEGVSIGLYDMALGSLTLTSYMISKMGLHNLNITGKIDYNVELGFRIRDDWGMFVTILNKALDSITQEEHQKIGQKWVQLSIEEKVDYDLIIRIIIIGALVPLALFYWNYQLKQQVNRKTSEISRLLRFFDEHIIASKTDLNGNITYASEAFCKISGNTKDFLIGKNHRIGKHPDNDPKIYEQMWSTITSGKVWKGRVKNKKKDGGYYWVDSTIEQDYDDKGNLIGYFSIRHDVTAQVELQKIKNELEHIVKERTLELTYLNQQQQAIFHSASIGIVLLKDRVIKHINNKIIEIFGYSEEELINASTRVWYLNDDDYNLVASKYEILKNAKTASWDQKFKRKNQSSFWARIHMCAIDDNDLSKGIVATIDDITLERQALDDIKNAKQIAEDAAKIKSEFLANMSHEIRTPMNAIIGISYLALQTDLTKQQKSYLEKIENAAKNLLGIINDILDFSKIEAGKMSLEHRPFYLEEILENLSDLFVFKTQEKGLEFLYNIDSQVPTALIGDSLRLSQILINLISNAVKFTKKGEIIVSAMVIEKNKDSVKLRFDVQDSGIGLNKEMINNIFKSFHQADGSTTRMYGGTGLGLAISKHIVEMMGGEIGVKSEFGKGSDFYFTVNLGLQNEQKKHVYNTDGFENIKILIVDDNASAREILESIVKSLNFETKSVSNGYDAIIELSRGILLKQPYNLVLMDWMMPEMDGIETINKIRSSNDISSTPTFIMVTAYSKDELLQKTKDIQIDGVLTKPVSPSTLYDTILEAFGKQISIKKEQKKVRLNDYNNLAKKLSGAKILIVEDNIQNQEIAKEFLEKVNVSTEIANNGLEAISKVKNNSYDAILMDCQMPVMDGYEATSILKSDDEFKKIPIIAMTANALEGDKQKCIDSGMDDYISKPLDVNKFYQILSKWVKFKNHSALSQIDSYNNNLDDIELDIEGINISLALSRVGGDKQLLLKQLNRFIKYNKDFTKIFLGDYNNRSYDSLIRDVHSMKGICGSIGAIELYEQFISLEEKLKIAPNDIQNDFIYKIVDGFDKLINNLNKQLEIINGNILHNKKSEIILDKSGLKIEMLTLEKMLNELDSNALELSQQICDKLIVLGKDILASKLTESVNNFNFEVASEILKQIEIELFA